MKRLVCVACLLLGACGAETALPPLPEGIQTLTGTIVPTTITTARRGTHVLRQGGGDHAYLESSKVLLRDYQGRTTAFRGHFERNIDARDLPVFVVESIVSSEQIVRSWSNAKLGIEGMIPTRWGVADTDAGSTFIPAGSLTHIVAISRVRDMAMPSGIALSVAGGRAIRFLDDISGEQRIAIEQSSGYIDVGFTPQHEQDVTIARNEWLAFLRSLKVQGIVSAQSSSRIAASSDTSVRDRTPCGGVAGILCPAGQYCEITDLDQNIGICRSVHE